MKILMAAYVCQPNAGSEEGVGWNWAVQAAAHGHEVFVITQERFRAAIETELSQHPIPNLTFYYLEAPKPWSDWIDHFGWKYYLWQIALTAKAKALHATISFDLAHHLTYAIDWMPSGLCLLKIPFIWGPIGGSTHHHPKNIDLGLSPSAHKLERQRSLLQWLFKTHEAIDGVPQRYHSKVIPTVHVGVRNEDLPDGYDRTNDSRSLRILTGGRLVHWKGFDLLLEGFKLHLQETGADTQLVLSARWGGETLIKDLAEQLGIAKHIVFLGDLPSRDALFLEMQHCDLYALLTWRDGPPTAMLEAMLAGLPILCLDIGAVHELVPDEAGFKIPLHSRPQIIREVANTLTWASQNRSAVEQKGQKGRQHVLETHNWDTIGNHIQNIYETLQV
jgi:glycosyltransferase involved in cell wall biosynthesis